MTEQPMTGDQDGRPDPMASDAVQSDREGRRAVQAAGHPGRRGVQISRRCFTSGEGCCGAAACCCCCRG